MTNLADDLRQAADSVALLGSSSADLAALPDVDVLAGQKRIASARRLLDAYAVWLAATIADRSRPELGHSGLAAQQGFLSPEALIQKWTGSSQGDAYKLVAVGTLMADAEAADKLGAALEALHTEASSLNADQVFTRARRMRDTLDEAGIAAREKQAYDDRYLRVYRLGNGNVRLNGLFDPEDGEFVVSTFDSITGPRRGAVRFVDAERVLVTEQALKMGPGEGTGMAEPTAHGQVEGNPVSISQETIDRLVCDTGTHGIRFDADGQIINVGRDERLFTEKQRAAMSVRDGGCRWVDCDRSPAWSEAPRSSPVTLKTGASRRPRPASRGRPPGLGRLDGRDGSLRVVV